MPIVARIVLAYFVLVIAWAGPSLLARQRSSPATPADRWTIIHCGTLLAVPGQAARSRVSVIARNDRIESVRDGYVAAMEVGGAEASNVRTIDLKDHFVLPGLADCHVHLTHETSPEGRLRTVTESDADAALNGVVYARRTIEAGFTFVRDVGSRSDTCLALRDAIADGKIVGPRVLCSGQSITPTGGHADRSNSFREDLFAMPGPMQGVADGVDACRLAVRHQVKQGVDLIKITATGGVLSNIGAGLEQQFFDDELRAIVETAHLLNKKVAAHAHGVNGINAALRAGVDSIEHGTFLDDESIRLFKEKGAYYVPTVTAGKSVAEYAKIPGYYIGPVVEKATTVGPRMSGALEKAWKAGVKIAFGTDAGVFPHGENAREFVYMAEAGMPPEQIIICATLNAADLMGVTKDLGSIEPGKYADLVAVKGDPLKDIGVLQRVEAVVKGAEVVLRR